MPFKMDNPGGGDCLFYALSVGIIDAIQNLPEQKAKKLWDSWAEKGDIKGVSFEKIQSIYLDDNTFKKYKDLMLELQFSLRHIAAETMKDRHHHAMAYQYGENSTKTADLEEVNVQLKDYDKLDARVENSRDIVGDKLTEARQRLNDMRADPQIEALRKQQSLLRKNTVVENSPIYKNFSLMVEEYKKGRFFPPDDKLNILNSSHEIHKLAKKSARHIKKNNLSPKQEEIYLIKLIQNYQNQFFDATDSIKNRYMWGSHENAGAILTALEVNSTLNSGNHPPTIDKSFRNAPMIELNNHGNIHWTTQISEGLNDLTSKEQKILKATVGEKGKGLSGQKHNAYKKEINKLIKNRDAIFKKAKEIGSENDLDSEELAIKLQAEELRKAGFKP